jgi:hypothetical protein
MPEIALPDLRELGRRGRSIADDWRGTYDRGQKETSGRGRSIAETLSNVDINQIDLGKADPRKIDFGKIDLEKLGVSKLDLSKLDLPARAEIAKQIRKASREQWRRASREIDRAMQRRQQPVWPWAVLGVAGGLTVGWALATSPTTRPWIERTVDRIRQAFNDWWSQMVARSEMSTDTTDYPPPTSTAYEADTYAAAIGAERSGVGIGSSVPVGPGSSNEVPPTG